jgi:hypothetical protein
MILLLLLLLRKETREREREERRERVRSLFFVTRVSSEREQKKVQTEKLAKLLNKTYDIYLDEREREEFFIHTCS